MNEVVDEISIARFVEITKWRTGNCRQTRTRLEILAGCGIDECRILKQVAIGQAEYVQQKNRLRCIATCARWTVVQTFESGIKQAGNECAQGLSFLRNCGRDGDIGNVRQYDSVGAGIAQSVQGCANFGNGGASAG